MLSPDLFGGMTKLKTKYGSPEQRQYSKNHYDNNKEQYRARNNRRRQEVMKRVMDYLLAHPCIDCGEADPIVLDFDHVKGNKSFNIADKIRTTTWPIIFREIQKCVVRCANCHRRKTNGHFKKFLCLSRNG